MALITCPECGKQVSDKAPACIGCGFPLTEYVKQKEEEKKEVIRKQVEEFERLPEKGSVCEICGYTAEGLVPVCKNCSDGGRMVPVSLLDNIKKNEIIKSLSEQLDEKPPFDGIYTYHRKKKVEVYCPRCRSTNCEFHVVSNTRTQVRKNLNPLTQSYITAKTRSTTVPSVSKMLCKDCGHVFDTVEMVLAEKKRQNQQKLQALKAKNPGKA